MKKPNVDKEVEAEKERQRHLEKARVARGVAIRHALDLAFSGELAIDHWEQWKESPESWNAFCAVLLATSKDEATTSLLTEILSTDEPSQVSVEAIRMADQFLVDSRSAAVAERWRKARK